MNIHVCFNLNWDWYEMEVGQPRRESDWMLFNISIGTDRKLMWGSLGENLIELYSTCKGNWYEIDLGQPQRESDWILFEFELKLKGNWSGVAQWRIWLTFTYILIEIVRKLIRCSPRENLIAFHFNFDWKWQELDLGQPRKNSD